MPLGVLLLSAPLWAAGCVGGGEGAPPLLSTGGPLVVDSEGGLAVVEITPDAEGELVQGEHAFSVSTQGLAGASPVELVSVGSFMPAHGHGTDAPEIVAVDGGYRIEALNLFMPGRWELTLGLRVDAAEDRAVFSVDVR